MNVISTLDTFALARDGYLVKFIDTCLAQGYLTEDAIDEYVSEVEDGVKTVAEVNRLIWRARNVHLCRPAAGSFDNDMLDALGFNSDIVNRCVFAKAIHPFALSKLVKDLCFDGKAICLGELVSTPEEIENVLVEAACRNLTESEDNPRPHRADQLRVRKAYADRERSNKANRDFVSSTRAAFPRHNLVEYQVAA